MGGEGRFDFVAGGLGERVSGRPRSALRPGTKVRCLVRVAVVVRV